MAHPVKIGKFRISNLLFVFWLMAITVSAGCVFAMDEKGITSNESQTTKTDESIIIKGRASYKDVGNGELVSVHNDQNAANILIISEKDGQYYWASNENKKLNKIEKTDNKGVTNYTTFVNPDGEGQIFIKHAKLLACDLRESNYKEYRTSDIGLGLVVYSGFTDPYPYPVARTCAD
ncbi:hypothetical protein [Pseudomonas sp. R5(2019)]|uniref:hypothetical protein n=1 Tax=Pseudomonas sp. R5(2019) TaxID=2697566 RepID=UPI00141339A1|nr:hypothetical protein [Pseudomonas sp. R5(2019)]NBA97853.1 hypothetical protein [Pseudomonas sp. R5(2019)]